MVKSCFPSSTQTHQIDFEESSLQGRFSVKPNVDAELDESEAFEMSAF